MNKKFGVRGPVKRGVAVMAALMIGAGSLAACSSTEGDTTAATQKAKTIDPRFGDSPRTVADAAGLESSKLFFDNSETAIITADDVASRARAASLSVVTHAPVIVDTPEARAEIERLGATKVLLVGVPQFTAEGVETIADPGTAEALSELTSLRFETREVGSPEELPAAIAQLDPEHPVELTVAGFPLEAKPAPADANLTFPVSSSRDGGQAPVIVASPQTDPVDVANARAYGAEVKHLEFADPRIQPAEFQGVAGTPIVALGSAFGSSEQFAHTLDLLENTKAEINGGGQLVFPGRRMIALYGHPSGGALGVMGEFDPAGAVAHAQELVEQYKQADPSENVMPAFEIIATVASEFPGVDGDFSNEADPEELKPYIDAIVDAGGYVVLDLQPGRARFIDQARRYEELLKNPNVGLALDPEWRIGPDEMPLQRVGSVEAAEVNEVAQWLADLTRENQLPQKAFVLHQFQVQMLRDRDQINTAHPELAFVLHADGHGVPEQKFDTWNVLRQDLGPGWFMAWKNFIDEDTPTFTPEQTWAIDPRPWFVSYQ